MGPSDFDSPATHVPAPTIARLDRTVRAHVPLDRASLAPSILALEEDLDALDASLAATCARHGEVTPMYGAILHMLEARGKLLRPTCVFLAAALFGGGGERARAYAYASELVHGATLLHDDVVDDGTERRGRPAARVVYGNAASVFGGDWMLVEAVKRIHGAGQPDVLHDALRTLDTMLEAESLQLALRGSLRATREDYLRIVRGKTASLFRWAMVSGARAADAPANGVLAVATFAEAIGTAFQVVDDALDFADTSEATGKSVLTDLREGKVTYPVLVALEARPELAVAFRELRDAPHDGRADDARFETCLVAVRNAIVETGALATTRDFAGSLVARALDVANGLPDTPARTHLLAIASTLAERRM
ncbi:MAG: polyprenyl synthetase family protein [Polyangiaceae bacterium]